MLAAVPLGLLLIFAPGGWGMLLPVRWTALALGAAASLFALFGPADGLI